MSKAKDIVRVAMILAENKLCAEFVGDEDGLTLTKGKNEIVRVCQRISKWSDQCMDQLKTNADMSCYANILDSHKGEANGIKSKFNDLLVYYKGYTHSVSFIGWIYNLERITAEAIFMHNRLIEGYCWQRLKDAVARLLHLISIQVPHDEWAIATYGMCFYWKALAVTEPCKYVHETKQWPSFEAYIKHVGDEEMLGNFKKLGIAV